MGASVWKVVHARAVSAETKGSIGVPGSKIVGGCELPDQGDQN